MEKQPPKEERKFHNNHRKNRRNRGFRDRKRHRFGKKPREEFRAEAKAFDDPIVDGDLVMPSDEVEPNDAYDDAYEVESGEAEEVKNLEREEPVFPDAEGDGAEDRDEAEPWTAEAVKTWDEPIAENSRCQACKCCRNVDAFEAAGSGEEEAVKPEEAETADGAEGAEGAEAQKHVKVVGVRFKKAGKIYYFDPGDFELRPGTGVIVETARGIEYGDVVVGVKFVPEDDVVAPLRKVISIATDEDRLKVAENRKKAEEAFDICLKKIAEHQLPMKLIDVEYTFDNSKVIFYFTADGRIDFRELVRDLASIFKTRIELRQIGVRDEAKMLGGLGCCGRPLCCATFLGDFEPVSIKMAKEQNLSLNPTKISGICGRLMCCLKFESDTYKDVKSELPKVGSTIKYGDGTGIVIEQDLLNECVKVELEDGTIAEVPIEEIEG